MRRYYIVLIISLLSFVGVSSTAQLYKNKPDSLWSVYQIKQGHRAYNNMRYLQSVDKWEHYFNRGVLADTTKSKLAQACINISNSDLAERVLRSMDTLKMASVDFYNMAQCLKLNGNYDESDVWMSRFEQRQQHDSRPAWQSNSSAQVKKIYNRTRYNVSLADFNSPQSDFGAFQNGGDVVFASARKVDEVIARQYAWKESPYLNVYKVTVTDTGFTQPVILSSKLKTVYHDGPVSYSRDGNEMFVTQNPYNFPGTFGKKQVNQFRLLSAHKQANGTWSELKPLPFNGDGFSTGHGALSNDGQTLWFASDRPGGKGRSDIYFVKRQGDGWGEPQNAGTAINTEGDEMFPFEAADGKLYFSSNGHLTLGGLDICIAFPTSSGFQVRNMGYPINSTKDDFSLFMAPDGKRGYFSSNRANGKGDDDIYSFEVTDPIVLNREIQLVVRDKNTGLILPKAIVTVKENQKSKDLVTDENGKIVYGSEEANNLTVNTEPLGYKAASQTYELTNDVNQFELLVEPLPVWGVYGTVTDKATGAGVDSIQVLIRPVGGRDAIGNLTLDGGSFRNVLQPETDYAIVLTNDNYFTKKGYFTTKGRQPGWININEFMETVIEKVDLDKTIEIPNIYYDLGKWNIRKDAAPELDKVVQFMLDNPNLTIELGSHTDSRGNATSNEALSQKRAQSAVDYIIKKGGIAKDRIVAKGYGESKLKNQCADGVTCTEAEHQQNRRTEIRVLSVK